MSSAKTKIFKNVKAVLDYLQNHGYQVTQPTIYRHAKAGKLVANDDGTFNETAVIGYASTFLTMDSDVADGDDMQRQKAEAETRRAKALAQVAEAKAKELDGAYVLRAEFDRALAQRALLFKTDLTNLIYDLLPEICAILDGDVEAIPEAIQVGLGRLETALARYAEPGRVFEVPEADHA